MATKNESTFGPTMFRALITQKNDDGTIKEINGVKQVGGVIFDRIGEALGYVYAPEKYDNNNNRLPEHYGENWYVK